MTGVPLLGRSNPRVARLHAIVRRREAGFTVVDGVKLAAELAERGVAFEAVFMSEDCAEELVRYPFCSAAMRERRAFLLKAETFRRIAPSVHAQGVLAVVDVPQHHLSPAGITLFLDRVQDPGNVGAVIRCAAAFGASAVACSPGCGDPFSPRAVRASAGQSLLLPVAAGVDFASLARAFSEAGGELVATVGSGGISAARWQPRTPLLLVFGNEGSGLAPEVQQLCKTRIHVPLLAVESLNVAVAAGVILAGLAGVVPSPILNEETEARR